MQEIRPFQFYDSPIKSGHVGFDTDRDKRFQFYDSPIKRDVFKGELSLEKEFQFYDSPIKRSMQHVHADELLCFNSMIVRLKVARKKQRSSLQNTSFNSMIVRLKGRLFEHYFFQAVCFNSMIVRLKVDRVLVRDSEYNVVSIL